MALETFKRCLHCSFFRTSGYERESKLSKIAYFLPQVVLVVQATNRNALEGGESFACLLHVRQLLSPDL